MISLGIRGKGDGSDSPMVVQANSLFGGGFGTDSSVPNSGAARGSGFARLPPQIRNPLLNVVNFYLPQDRKVLNQWCRYYDRFHPIVGNALDLHAETIVSPFDLEGIDDSQVMNVYKEMVNDYLELFNRMVEGIHEFYLIGEWYPFLQWNTQKGIFDQCVSIDPDLVHIHPHPFVHLKDAVTFEVEPSQTLIEFINSSDPLDQRLKKMLDPTIIAAVQSGTMMRISPFNMTSLLKKSSPYDDRGTSIVLKALKYLMYEDKLMEANYAIADGHVTPRWIFKLGDPANKIPPRKKDLEEFRNNLMRGWYDHSSAIISTYALQVEAIGSAGKILPLTKEFDWVEDRVLTAMFTHKAATTGVGPTYANAAVAKQIMNGRYFNRRQMIETWVKKKIFAPVARAHGFYKPLPKGEKHKSKKERELWIPNINWRNKLDLTDTNEFKDYLLRMREKLGVSMKTVYRYIGIDYNEEEKNLTAESGSVFDPVYQDYRKSHAKAVFEKKEKEQVSAEEAEGMVGGAGGGLPGGEGGGEVGEEGEAPEMPGPGGAPELPPEV